ncbi:unnamed protein product [Ectocarpus sp. 8 AP-2014]
MVHIYLDVKTRHRRRSPLRYYREYGGYAKRDERAHVCGATKCGCGPFRSHLETARFKMFVPPLYSSTHHQPFIHHSGLRRLTARIEYTGRGMNDGCLTPSSGDAFVGGSS